MKELYESMLFEKHILVHDSSRKEEHPFETLFSLANLFGIRIISGEELVQSEMIHVAERELGTNVPEPFYRGFPESVRELSPDRLLFDQLVHYMVTYGFGDFSAPGHSLFEGDRKGDFERAAFKENTEIREFSVLTEDEAMVKLTEMADGLLAGSRPLSKRQYELVLDITKEPGYRLPAIASKDTAVRLLLDTGSLRFADSLMLSDVIRITDELSYAHNNNMNLRKLNLRNKDRVFLTGMIDRLLANGRCDLRTCYEKKQIWNGLLHHIHYKAKSPEGQAFVDAMRGKGNRSVYSDFERAMSERRVSEAARILREGKGSGAVLRNLNYLISRCGTKAEVDEVLSCVDTKNVILLIQLLLQYSNYKAAGEARTFRFTKHTKLKVYKETEEDMARRGTNLSEDVTGQLAEVIRTRLAGVLKGRLGKVYISPGMERYALPLQETTSQGGFGVLTRGTRIPIGEGRKLRAFTYWEKVNDIDLSVFGIDETGGRREFSWRTMAGNQSDAITYSGDETSGYNGGSEFFDIDLPRFRNKYPDMRYLIFCDNVFSRVSFTDCFCRAGYMFRDRKDSGEIFEPKTVESAYRINCDSMFAYLYGIDLATNDLIWLNMARDSQAAVAGTTGMDFLTDYFHVTDVINVASFFTMMATEVVSDPAEADVVVTDQPVEVLEETEVIREFDLERMIALMNQ